MVCSCSSPLACHHILMKPVGSRVIETERLIMRPLQEGDAPFIYKNWTSDPMVTRYLTWDAHASLQDTENYVRYKLKRNSEDPYRFDWVLVLKETGEPIGEMEGVRASLQDNLVEMGDAIGSKFWNRGIATEALKAFIRYLFEVAEVEKIVACHISTNPASGRVMEKAGMHKDGVLKGYLIDKTTSRREDSVWYSIDKKDYGD